jgi:hypothetical protein
MSRRIEVQTHFPIPSSPPSELIQRFVAAVEEFPIMSLADRFFVPRDHDYRRFGRARAAASSLAFGAGGFSSRSRTRKLFLSESCT